eukprot:PITA_13641
MGSSTLFPIEDKLCAKSDYHGWKMSLDLTLEDQGVLDHVRDNIVEPPSNAPTAARNKWKIGEVKTKKIIQDSIDEHLVAHISDLNTSKEIYDRLVSLFKVNDANQVLFLRNKLKEIKKGKDESMQAYFLRITEIKNDLLSIGEIITDREMTLTTFGGLPSEWDSHWDDDKNPSHANQRNDKSNSKGKRSAGNQGRGQPFKKARNSRYESNIVDNKQDEYYLPAALSTSAPSDSMGIWFIDSGASRHFTSYKEVLHNLIDKETNLEIVLGDNMKYPVKGVGNVSLKLNQGNMIHLQDVLYVPDLKKNLVSISTMEDKGYKVTFGDGKVRVWKSNVKDVFTLGFRVDSLYQVGGSLLGVMSCDTSLQSELWHHRFAHLHYKALPDVRQMVTGMPEFQVEKEGVCPGCAAGKLKRGPFPSSQSKTSDILQLVHLDISSMMPVNSLGGYSYYLTFTDDYSRKT